MSTSLSQLRSGNKKVIDLKMQMKRVEPVNLFENHAVLHQKGSDPAVRATLHFNYQRLKSFIL